MTTACESKIAEICPVSLFFAFCTQLYLQIGKANWSGTYCQWIVLIKDWHPFHPCFYDSHLLSFFPVLLYFAFSLFSVSCSASPPMPQLHSQWYLVSSFLFFTLWLPPPLLSPLSFSFAHIWEHRTHTDGGNNTRDAKKKGWRQ